MPLAVPARAPAVARHQGRRVLQELPEVPPRRRSRPNGAQVLTPQMEPAEAGSWTPRPSPTWHRPGDRRFGRSRVRPAAAATATAHICRAEIGSGSTARRRRSPCRGPRNSCRHHEGSHERHDLGDVLNWHPGADRDNCCINFSRAARRRWSWRSLSDYLVRPLTASAARTASRSSLTLAACAYQRSQGRRQPRSKHVLRISRMTHGIEHAEAE